MTVTATGTVVDVTGKPDTWHWGFASMTRESSGKIISTASRNVAPDASGVLTVQLEPGYCVITHRSDKWEVTVPDHDVTLRELVTMTVPPGTSTDALNAAIAAYFALNPTTAIDGGTP